MRQSPRQMAQTLVGAGAEALATLFAKVAVKWITPSKGKTEQGEPFFLSSCLENPFRPQTDWADSRGCLAILHRGIDKPRLVEGENQANLRVNETGTNPTSRVGQIALNWLLRPRVALGGS